MEPDVRERFERLEANLTQLTQITASLVQVATSHQRLDQLTDAERRLNLAQAETQEELSALIRMMDEWIRRNPGNGVDRPPRS